MRRLLNLFFMIVLLTPLWGQQPVRFDTVRFGPVSYAIGYSAFQDDLGYKVFSLEKHTGTPFQEIVVAHFDQEGGSTGEQYQTTYGADQIGNSSPVVRVDSGYVSGCDRYQIGMLDSLFFQFYDASGALVSERFIDADTAMTMRGMTKTMADEWLLCGLHQFPEEAYVYHLDNAGNIKGYHGYSGFDGEDVVEGRDSSWYVCGRGNQLNNYNRGVVLRSDTTGQELWRRTDGQALSAYFSMVGTMDNSVIAVGTRGQADSNANAVAVKYNSAGALQWLKEPWQTSSTNWPCLFTCGFEAVDSSLVFAGWLRDTIYRDAGMLFKLDKDGNTLWHRFYSHYPGASYGKDQIFWDVKPTSDGGMVLTGETNSDDYAYAQLWLLKLDSMGCLVPGCGNVGVQEYTDLFVSQLHVSPNPASDAFTFSLPLPEGAEVTGQVQAQLLDATGKLVLQQAVQQNLNVLSSRMNVRTLPAGTYYLHLRDAKRWLAGSKVIVQ